LENLVNKDQKDENPTQTKDNCQEEEMLVTLI
jgi:hypothetical protein